MPIISKFFFNACPPICKVLIIIFSLLFIITLLLKVVSSIKYKYHKHHSNLPIGKSVFNDDPKNIKNYLEEAYYQAMTDRKGPVWLDVPLDIQKEQA